MGENPAKGTDKGCPENVLPRVKHSPEPSWEFHCRPAFRNCLLLFLGSDLPFLSLSLLISLLFSFFWQPELHSAHARAHAHTHTRPSQHLIPPFKNTSCSKQLSLLQVARFKIDAIEAFRIMISF